VIAKFRGKHRVGGKSLPGEKRFRLGFEILSEEGKMEKGSSLGERQKRKARKRTGGAGSEPHTLNFLM